MSGEGIPLLKQKHGWFFGGEFDIVGDTPGILGGIIIGLPEVIAVYGLIKGDGLAVDDSIQAQADTRLQSFKPHWDRTDAAFDRHRDFRFFHLDDERVVLHRSATCDLNCQVIAYGLSIGCFP